MSDIDLEAGEPHPAAISALGYLRSLDFQELMIWAEGFASTAIEGNRLASICGETLRRFMEGEPMSDRYLLGLVYTIRYGKESVIEDVELPEVLKDPQATLEHGRKVLEKWNMDIKK